MTKTGINNGLEINNRASFSLTVARTLNTIKTNKTHKNTLLYPIWSQFFKIIYISRLITNIAKNTTYSVIIAHFIDYFVKISCFSSVIRQKQDQLTN